MSSTEKIKIHRYKNGRYVVWSKTDDTRCQIYYTTAETGLREQYQYREFLNDDDATLSAMICVGADAEEIKISDCSRIVVLDFYVPTALGGIKNSDHLHNNVEESKKNIDSRLAKIKKIRRALDIVEHALYNKRDAIDDAACVAYDMLAHAEDNVGMRHSTSCDANESQSKKINAILKRKRSRT